LRAEAPARAQIAFTISFHIVFPAFSIGLASYLAVLNALWLRTGERTCLDLFEYWKKILAVVAVGTLMPATWIMSANSWMQTPAGYGFNDAGQFVPQDWWAIVFNPSFPYRLTHMVLAAFLTTSFVVAGVAGWHLRRDASNIHTRRMFSMAMWMAALVTPIQIAVGDARRSRSWPMRSG